jgi:hypothetical protein
MTDETTGVQQPQQPGLEDKIEAAAAKASEIVAAFSPAAGQAIAMGVEVEPVVSGLVKLFIHFFHHHVKKAA